MEYKVIEGGGITSPKGFTAGAVYVGVKSRKSQKPDVAVLYSETEASCAAVFTTNKFCAAPVILDREILKNGKARAIVINSGNANAATGTQGIEDARTVEREAEKLLGVGENEVFVCSTGVIGQKLPVEKVLDGVRQIIPAKLDKANGSDAAYAIMTTDTVRKESAYELELSSGTIRIGAMAKGSGMIHPNMATTLAYVTTDAKCDSADLQKMLQFVENNLCTENPELKETELAAYLIKKLNRPMRVCGMVRNVGEPGGGPFLAYNADGTISLQILESSQIDMDDAEKKAMFEKGTHFNPVDLVCAIKDHNGKPFHLPDYVDPQTGFISHKSKDGKELKALELPGLWNGAMSDWSTVFVEVPLETFNPVKTVNDLYREQHQ